MGTGAGRGVGPTGSGFGGPALNPPCCNEPESMSAGGLYASCWLVDRFPFRSPTGIRLGGTGLGRRGTGGMGSRVGGIGGAGRDGMGGVGGVACALATLPAGNSMTSARSGAKPARAYSFVFIDIFTKPPAMSVLLISKGRCNLLAKFIYWGADRAGSVACEKLQGVDENPHGQILPSSGKFAVQDRP